MINKKEDSVFFIYGRWQLVMLKVQRVEFSDI